jgi:hypothetical protein
MGLFVDIMVYKRLALILAILLACTGGYVLFGDEIQSQVPSLDTSDTQSESQPDDTDTEPGETESTSESEHDETDSESGDAESTSQRSTQYKVGMDTGEVVIRLSDLDGQYDFVDESLTYQSNASEDVRAQFEQKGVLKQHKRLFEVENRSFDAPIFVISSIAVYENDSAATQDLEGSVDALHDRGTVNSVRVNDTTATVAKYRDQQGNYQTITYLQQRNAVYFVLTTDDSQYRQQTTLKLLAEMNRDMNRSEGES